MPDKVLAFYIRLSSEDRDLKTNALKNESNSVFNHDVMYRGWITPKNITS